MGKKYNPKPSPHDHMPRPYEKTPIYQATREVLRETHAMTARMSQGYKYIWSSSECGSLNAWIQKPSNGYQTNFTKANDFWVVPFRRVLA